MAARCTTPGRSEEGKESGTKAEERREKEKESKQGEQGGPGALSIVGEERGREFSLSLSLSSQK